MTCRRFVTWWSSYKTLTFERAPDETDISPELEGHQSTETGHVTEWGIFNRHKWGDFNRH